MPKLKVGKKAVSIQGTQKSVVRLVFEALDLTENQSTATAGRSAQDIAPTGAAAVSARIILHMACFVPANGRTGQRHFSGSVQSMATLK